MKALFNACLIFFLFNIVTGCSDKTFPTGNYQQAPVVADGDLNEWDKPIRFVSSGGQVLYNVTNDNDNIYIGLETHDEATALKILRSGINVYIDPAAGQSKTISLAFPLAATPAKNATDGSAKPNKTELRESLLVQAISFSTTGFKNMDNRLYDASDKSKIKVAIKPGENNGLGYEAIIPLQYIFGNEPVSKNTTRNISVGIVINAIKGGENYQNRSNTSGGGGGRHGGGGGRGRGMGGGGGSYRGNNGGSADPTMQTPDRASLVKEDANWYKFKLAVKK